MESAAPPTRDCVGEVVEKHCVRWEEKAGARKTGRDPCFKGLRDSCRKQLWARDRDMAVIIEGLMLDDGGVNSDSRLILPGALRRPMRLVRINHVMDWPYRSGDVYLLSRCNNSYGRLNSIIDGAYPSLSI